MRPPRKMLYNSRRGQTKLRICNSNIRTCGGCCLRIFMSLLLILSAAKVGAQEVSLSTLPPKVSESDKPASNNPQSQKKKTQPDQSQAPDTVGNTQPLTAMPGDQTPPAAGQQPQRILGIMPNFRAVSAGAIPPPPTPRQAFMIATQNTLTTLHLSLWVSLH